VFTAGPAPVFREVLDLSSLATTSTSASALDAESIASVFNAPEHQPLLRKAFALYSAKNKFVAKEGGHEAGFEALHMANTHLDLGELQVFLKAVQVVPRWIAVEKVQILFYQFVRMSFVIVYS
jgi:hypothetical protein